MDHGANRLFQQSLCESRSVTENLEPTSARLLSDLQKQITKLKGDVEVEKQKSRNIAKDSLGELKRQRDEYERRLEQSLDSLNLRKDQEKAAELKRLEDYLTRQKEQEKKLLIKEKNDEMRELQKKLQKRHDENIKVVLKQQRKLVMEEMQGKLPDEEAVAARESKLARELFSLGEENWRLEDQIRNLTQENRTQIDLMRRMKQEHESELTHFHRQNKTDAARDVAKLRLAEQIIQEKDHDLMEVSHQAGYAQMEVDTLKEELVSLKSTRNMSSVRPGSSSPSLGAASTPTKHVGILHKRLEDLEASVRKLEEEKAQMKMENASLRKKVVQGGGGPGGDGDSKSLKEADEKMKRLRKRNADLVGLAKTLEERCKSLKLDNDKLLAKRTADSADSEQQLRKTLSRQHAKDISDYTKQINSKEKENQELRRRLSKYEVSSGVRHDSLTDLKRRLKIMAREKLQVEKLVAKLYAQLPEFTDLELYTKDYVSESTHLQETLEENVKLRMQLQELRQPNEGDADSGQGGEVDDTSGNLLADLREENQRLSSQLQQVSSLQEENERLTNELSDLKLAHTFAERRLKLLEEDLEQAKMLSQELERTQDLYNELEKEVTEARGLLNERDQDICQLELVNRSTSAALLEKEEEISSRNSQVIDLRQVLTQKEESLQELEEQLQMTKPSNTAHVGLQTNLSSPKSSPKSPRLPTYSPKTSPLASPKTQSRRTSSVLDETQSSIPENSLEKENCPDNPSPKHSTAHREHLHEHSNLHAELQAAGMDITDPYDSEGFSGSVGTGSNVSLDDLLSAKTSGHSLHGYQAAHGTSHPPPVREEEEKDRSSRDPSSGGSVSQLAEQAASVTNSYEPSAELSETREGKDEVDGAIETVHQLKEAWVLSDEDDIHSCDRQRSPSLPPPPQHLELTKKLLEEDNYCIVVEWQPPLQLPHDATGYKVFVNDSLMTTVDGAETSSALLTNIPKNKHLKISVHTVTQTGESDDPTSLIELNPEFPETPTHLELLLEQSLPPLLQLSWAVSRDYSTPTVQSYQVFINRTKIVKSIQAAQLHTTQTENDEDTDNSKTRITTTLTPEDFAHLTTLKSSEESCILTVRACGDHYMSSHSKEINIPPHLIAELLPWTREEPVSDEAYSDGESDEEREEDQIADMDSSTAVSHQLEEGGPRRESMDEQKLTEVIEGHYYQAFYTYDPTVNSPNDDAEEVELDFVEGDIIVARGGLDEDGFFEGELYGRIGLVPCNMVEHITDPAVLADIDATIATLAKNRQERISVNGHSTSFRLIRAVCSYNPAVDSPNTQHDDELQLEEGDVLTVLGGPDIDGFYEAELKGQQGIVAKNLVEPIVETNSDGDLAPSKSRTEVSSSELSQVKA